MADVSGKFFSAKKVRTGVSPSSPGIIEGTSIAPVTPEVSGFVPYTGATENVDLGEFGLDTGFVNLDTTPTGTPASQGTIYWDDSKSTAALIMNGTTQHIGQDTFFYVKNSSGSSIAKGTAVRFDGTDGGSGHLLIAPFLANGTYPSSYFMGVTAETIANGSFGQVMHFGELSGINTSGYTAGALLYASTTVAGGFQTTAPVAPNNIVLIAAAINSTNNGDIIVRPTYGSNINQDEGVKIVSPTTGQLLQLQSNGLWENKTKAQVLGGTSTQFVKGDGSLDSTTYQSTADKAQPNGYASLDSNGKVPLTQINDALLGNVNYQGLWNAFTNTPTLANPPSSGTKGYYYIVSTAGTFAGISFEVGDWIISNGSAWQKVDNTDAVSSVFGRTGNVVAANGDYTTAQVTESGNLYFTQARSRQAISLTTSGTSGAATYDNSTGVFNIPNYGSALSGYLPLTGGTLTGPLGGTSISLSGSLIAKNATTSAGVVTPSVLGAGEFMSTGSFAGYFWENRSGGVTSNSNWYGWYTSAGIVRLFNGSTDIVEINGTTGAASFDSSVTASSIIRSGGTSSQFLKADGSVDSTTYVSNVTASSPLASSGGTTPNITIQQASGSQSGFLSSTDWTTFNNKQNALTNPITGTGTSGQIAYFTGTTSITSESNLFWDATNDRLGIGTNSPAAGLEIVTDSGTTNALRVVSNRAFNLNTDVAINFRYKYDSTNFTTGGLIVSAKDNNTSGSQSGNLQFYTNNAGSVGQRLIIASTGAATFSSSVTATSFSATDATGSAILTTNGGGEGVLSVNTANPLRFFTNGSEKMRITSGGNVGIGNGFTPSNILHAYSSLPRIISDTSSRYAVFNLYAAGSEKGAFYLDNTNKEIILEANGDNTYSLKLNTGGSPRMTITSGGNVLIGTQSDIAGRLRVKSAGNDNYAIAFERSNSTTTIGGFYQNSTSSGEMFLVASNGSQNVKISSTQFSYWAAPSVNFAIGTSTDSTDKLRVNGNTFTNTLMTWNPENDNRSGVEWRFGAASIASITPNRRLRVSVGGVEYYIGAVEV